MIDRPQVFRFQENLLKWYDAHRRALPWRALPGGVPNAYHVLVSELMLQQTQVASVVEYFKRFIARWPTLADLAAADEQQVLLAWQGLGYYSRARNLLATARQVMSQLGGSLPADVAALRRLPGIGAYTAGAIASLAFDVPAPILDGNVTRVLCRLDAVEDDPREPGARKALWARAGELVPSRRAGDFNSALMELGELVCTPRGARCDECPVAKACRALKAGAVERIPPAAPRRERPLERRWTLCIHRRGRWLIERRPGQGRWAAMWQFITVAAPSSGKGIESRLAPLGLKGRGDALGTVHHDLTHRRYEFEVFRVEVTGGDGKAGAEPGMGERCWVTLDELAQYPMSRPQARIAAMLGDAHL
jgi:A/G-specific adenine glycosylase